MRCIYLREATVMLVVARLAVRFVPPARVFAWASRSPRRIHRFAVEEIGWVSWAVETIGAKRWMNAASLPRALLRRPCFGAVDRQPASAGRCARGRTLAAYAWIEVGRNKSVVGAEAERFTPLAEFGGAPR